MSRQVVVFWVVAIGVFVASAVIAYAVAPASNQSFADAAAVLTFASLMAVGIERVVEFGWLLVDGAGRFGGYFPLNILMKQFEAVDTQTDRILGDVFTSTKRVLQDVIDTGGKTAEEVTAITGQMALLDAQRADLATRLGQVRSLSPGSGRLASTAAIADQMSSSMHVALAGLGQAATAMQLSIVEARSGAKTALEVINALGDNPSRRLASLLFSSSLGILVAGFVGVNLFKAVLEQSQGSAEAVLFGKIGVVVTGLVVGLGSGPTHEFVKGLQRYKESRGRTEIADLSRDAPRMLGATSATPAAPGAVAVRPQMTIRSTH